MYRSISTQAIVIRRARVGEFHKSLSLLTADLGLISAMAYGAYKAQSRLRLGSEPFTWCSAQLYHNPVKKTYKVTELEISASFEGLQAELGRMAAASLWAEIVQKSFGAGEMSGGLFGLFRESLSLLEHADPTQEQCLTLQFLWRFLGLAGYQPELAACNSCGATLEGKSAWFLPRSQGMLCAACAGQGGTQLPPGALRFIGATQVMPLSAAMDVQLEAGARAALRTTLLGLVQSVLEGPLTSIPWVRSGR
jgi:DNA repair protein RecO (recombination protein O)